MVSCNPRWHFVIQMIEAEKTPLTLSRLAVSNLIPGVNTLDLAHEMFSFLGTIVAAAVHKKRLRLAGGEKGNGIELWRRTFFDNAGGGEMADLSGEKFFFNYPRCTDLKHLHNHLEDWLEMRYKHGSGIDDKHLRIMFLSTLPQSLEDEISMKHDLGVKLSDAVEYVQARTNRSRERELVDRLAKDRRTNMGVNALTQPVPEQPQAQEHMSPDIVNQIINALQSQKRKQPDRGRSTERGGTPTRSRSASPKGDGAGKPRNKPDPKSGTCWWCLKPGHTKQFCSEYKAYCAKTGKKPLGTGGRTADKPRVAALTAGPIDSDTESERSSNGSRAEGATPRVSMFACLPGKSAVPPATTVNKFDALKDFDEEEDDEAAVMAHLGTFAHFVQVKSKKKSQKQRKKDRDAQRFPLPGMTTDYNHAVRVMANLKTAHPINDEDEEYALVDSGSAVHGNNPKKHFKHIPVTPSGKMLKCTTADGSPMDGSGGVQCVAFETDEGHECSVDFDELPVAMPILAVKLLTEKGHDVVFSKLGGGCITHGDSGLKTQIIEMDGVYFLRMKKIRPAITNGGSTFGRPGQSS